MDGRVRAALCAIALAAGVSPGAARADVTTLTLHDAARSEATDPDTALALARRRLGAHDPAAAVAGLQRYLGVYPQEVTVREFLAGIYLRVGDLTSAEAAYRDIVAAYPYDAAAHRRLGTIDMLRGNTDAAIAEFEAALPDAIDDLLAAHQRRGDVDAFERDVERRAAKRTGDAQAQYELAEVYDDLAQPRDAVTYFQRALTIYPTSTDALNGLAIAQMQIGEVDVAAETFARCLAVDAQNYACTNDLGSLDLDRKRFDDARAELLRARTLAPEGPEALVNLGYLADELGSRPAAIAYYVDAIDVWPYFPDAYVNLAYDRIRDGSFDAAETTLRKGLAIAPADLRLHYLLGIVDEVHGKRPEAVAEFTVAEASSNPDIVNSARANVADLQKASGGVRPTPPPPSPHQ